MAVKKLIITHYENLKRKYKDVQVENPDDALQKIEERLKSLIQFDAVRGIETIIVYLDKDETLGTRKVTSPTDDVQFKGAVDAACRVYKPDYLVILGAQDIVPHIRLQHPVYCSRTDYRKHLFSDMPYACEKEYSERGSDFLSPTRVVSRIPDVFNNAALGIIYLLSSLDAVMKIPTRDVPVYLDSWTVCTGLRKKPMGGILEIIYADTDMIPIPAVCPPATSDWPTDTYERLTHIHLLNGIPQSHLLYGEDDAHTRPVAIDLTLLNQNIQAGCIALERASYGGALYQPKGRAELPLVNAYLSSGAACVLGSTAVNYSNTEKMISADHLVAQFFLNLYNRTVGDAFLISRQWLLKNKYLLTTNDMAMFLGFTLYGDASAFPMGDAQPDFSVQPDPKLVGGYETDPLKLRQNSCFSFEYKDKAPIPLKNKTYMEAYLLVNYNIQEVTRFYCNELFENGNVNEKKMQYTAYIEKPMNPRGEHMVQDFSIDENNGFVGFSEEWYVFEGDEKGTTFKVVVTPD